jgi:preprotein translocase subunit YajC
LNPAAAVADAGSQMDSILDFFISPAYAQDAGQSPLVTFLPLIAIFVIFYFLIIRPQNKKQKEHREMVSALSTGDEVVTAGGVLGRVTAVGDQFLDVEIADNVTIKVQRHTVATVLPKGTVKSA